MFLGHGNALKESWDFTSEPDSHCVVTSEVMSIFKFVSFEAEHAVFPHWTLQISLVHQTSDEQCQKKKKKKNYAKLLSSVLYWF